jgi:ribose transport system permease protein
MTPTDHSVEQQPVLPLAADEPPVQVPPPAPRRSVESRVASIGSEYGVVIFLLLMIVGFSLWQSDTFPTTRNLQAVLSDQAIPGLLALAVILPLAAGEFDLSVAANLGFSSVLSAKLASNGMDPVLVIVVTLAAATLIGAINALLVVGIGVNAFIATLGMSTILYGGNLLFTAGNTIFQGIPGSFTKIATTEVLGLQIVVFYFLIFAIGAWYVLERTPFGRYLRATGMGREASRLSGIATRRHLSTAFIAAAFIAGICGVLQTARFGSAPSSVGPDFLLPAYAAAFLGATTIRRGMFNVWGTVVGVMLLAVGINGLSLAGAPPWVPPVFNGTALIVAVTAAVLVARRRESLA